MKQVLEKIKELEKRISALEGETFKGSYTVAPISRHKGMNKEQTKKFFELII